MAAEYIAAMGAKLKARREELGLTQEDVARQMPGKVTGNRVSLWERGKHRPHDDSLEALAAVLQVPISYFMASEPDKRSTPSLFDESNPPAWAQRLQESIDALRVERAEHQRVIEEMLERQTRLLTDIEALVVTLPADEETEAVLREIRALAREAALGDRALLTEPGEGAATERGGARRRRAAG